MEMSLRSVVTTGVATVTAGAIALTPTVSLDIARPSSAFAGAATGAGDFTQLPVRMVDVALTGALLELITNATVGVIELYYPVRNAGQWGIDLMNDIVYNPYIQVWPFTAWAAQVNAAWDLGTGILDDTPPGAGTVQLLVDAVEIPLDVVNGASLGGELQELGSLTVNALNYGAAYLINYGLFQLSYFTWIWVRPITPPLFPLGTTTAAFETPGFLSGQTAAEMFDLLNPAAAVPTARLAEDPAPEAGTLSVTAAPETTASDGLPAAKIVPDRPAPVRDGTPFGTAVAKAVVSAPTKATDGLVAAQGEVRSAVRSTVAGVAEAVGTGNRNKVRDSLRAVPAGIAKGVSAGAEKAGAGVSDAVRDVADAVAGTPAKTGADSGPGGADSGEE